MICGGKYQYVWGGQYCGPCRFWLSFMAVAIFVVGATGCCAAATSAKIVAVANTAIKNVANITVCFFTVFHLLMDLS